MADQKSHYEYVVIGAGAAGLTVGVGLQKLKKDILMIGKQIGGECTHTGCIPSKSFLSLAMHYVMKSQKQCNVELREGIMDRIRDKVAQVEKIDIAAVEKNNIPFLQGTAKFTGPTSIEVMLDNGGSKTVTFNTCIIATGSHPQRIEIDGLPKEKIITNDELFQLKEIPGKVVIIGGGVIATEVGTAFAKFCTKTTLIVRSEMIPHEPRECVAEVKRSMVEEFNAKIYEQVKDMKYDAESKKLILYDADGLEMAKVAEADYYMMALGRIPNVQGLELEKAGVHYEKDGIVVNKNLKTSNPAIFAIGDVIQGPKFTHLANNQGKYIVKRAIIPWAQRKVTPLPACTFSDPPITSVGDQTVTETVHRFLVDFSESDRGIVEAVPGLKGAVFVNMVTGHIMGASLVGHFGEHAINFFTLAITKKMTVWELETFMVPYPTYFSGIEALYKQFLMEYAQNWKQYLRMRIQYELIRLTPLFIIIAIAAFLLIGMGR